MINYYIQVLLFQTLFIIVYDLFLKRETFFQWNRFYLIATSLFAYFIPWIKINSIGNYMQQEFAIPTVFLNPETIFLNVDSLENNAIQTTKSISSHVTLENIYFLGFVLMLILFVLKIRQIISKIKNNKVIKNTGFKLVVIKNKKDAFSFFNYIFLGELIYNKDYKTVLKHELTHVKQRHSFDLLFFELQKIICWFNPYSYLFQQRISVLHEFIADEKNHSKKDNKAFFESLLKQTFNVENISFVNNYYKKSLLKKRIIMATKNKSKELLKMKYLLVLPVLFIMLLFSAFQKNNKDENKRDYSNFNTVINDSITPTKSIETVNYNLIEQTPVYPGCESLQTEKEKKACFIRKVSEFVSENFNIKAMQNIGLPAGKKRVNVSFIIDKKGNVNTIKIRASHQKIKDEVNRIINLLPQMKAGINSNGEKVVVTYNLPIVFNVEGETTKKSNMVTSKDEIEPIPFSTIGKSPIFPGCESLQSEKERKGCFIKKITQHVSDNFNIKAMQNIGLTSGRKRVSVQFLIDSSGNVDTIRARAQHPKIQEESIRIIKLLPKMKPGVNKNGENAKVRYNLPIIFNIEKNSIAKKSTSTEVEKIFLAGTIKNEFGYLRMHKNAIITSEIGAIRFEPRQNYKAVSFKVLVYGNKSISITGNKMNSELVKLIKKTEVGTRIKIYDIEVLPHNNEVLDKVQPINIKVK